MANAGRKTKYTPETVERILELLKNGNTDADTCALVGVALPTFYMWLKQKIEFSDAVIRARSEARELAVQTMRSAMQPYDQAQQTQETFTETRLNRKGEPYEYKRTRKTISATKMQGDWRAALEYLKRRDPDNWSDQIIIKIDPEWAAKLKQHGLTPMQAMEKLINALDKVESHG